MSGALTRGGKVTKRIRRSQPHTGYVRAYIARGDPLRVYDGPLCDFEAMYRASFTLKEPARYVVIENDKVFTAYDLAEVEMTYGANNAINGITPLKWRVFPTLDVAIVGLLLIYEEGIH